MDSFLQGFVLGFCIAAPVGPIGLLCIRRSIADGRAAGFVSGLGAASADALYGTIAAAGLTAITQFLLDYHRPIQLLGGAFLVYLGISISRSKASAAIRGPAKASNLATAYGSTFALTVANPATILAFVGIFAGLGVGTGSPGFGPAALLVAGVFSGSAAWWLVLSAAAHALGDKVGAQRLRGLNLVSGVLIVGFGLWQLAAQVR